MMTSETIQPDIFRAVHYGNKALVEKTLRNGTDVDITNQNGQTPLMIASMTGNIEIALLLLERGASIDKQDNFGYSAFKYARMNCQAKLLNFFKQRKTAVLA